LQRGEARVNGRKIHVIDLQKKNIASIIPGKSVSPLFLRLAAGIPSQWVSRVTIA